MLYDADATGTRRCPACQALATAKRNARASSAKRGYGSQHRAKRAALLAAMQDGDPCALCGQAMSRGDSIDLAHSADRTGYKGLAHARCNRGHVNE